MKKILTLIFVALCLHTTFAQAPQQLSYQAVVRNVDNTLVTDKNVGVRIQILQGNANGTSVYTEIHGPSTNVNGLISLHIGMGKSGGDFSGIDWANGPYFIQSEIDPSGGDNYKITGTTQILSVPYALHARVADSISGGTIDINESDPVFNSSAAKSIHASDITRWNRSASGTSTGGQTSVADDAMADLYRRVTQLEYDADIYHTVMDVDGNIYPLVTIGEMVWMGQNLRTTHYRDGTALDNLNNLPDNVSWGIRGDYGSYFPVPAHTEPPVLEPKSALVRGQKEAHPDYGLFYDDVAVKNNNLCPDGFRVANYNDWEYLVAISNNLRNDEGGLEPNFENPKANKDSLIASSHLNNYEALDPFGFSAYPNAAATSYSTGTGDDTYFWWVKEFLNAMNHNGNKEIKMHYVTLDDDLPQFRELDEHPGLNMYPVRCVKGETILRPPNFENEQR